MDLTEGSETSANIKRTLGKHPKVNTVKNEVASYVIPTVRASNSEMKTDRTVHW
jgi:hypothetical protein